MPPASPISHPNAGLRALSAIDDLSVCPGRRSLSGRARALNFQALRAVFNACVDGRVEGFQRLCPAGDMSSRPLLAPLCCETCQLEWRM